MASSDERNGAVQNFESIEPNASQNDSLIRSAGNHPHHDETCCSKQCRSEQQTQMCHG